MWLVLGIMGFAVFGSFFYYRKKYIFYSERVCRYAQQMMKGDLCKEIQNQDTLTSKMVMELQKMGEILEAKALAAEKEKAEVQQVVSDITHQLKTPLSNLKMYGDTLLEEELSKEEKTEFLRIMRRQIEKLEFLTDSLMKMSRLESGMIDLHPENAGLLTTISRALSAVVPKAEDKKISLRVDCRRTAEAVHDCRWTAEALENLLDNAIKYTDREGSVAVIVIPGEMYVEVRVRDNGMGIDPEHFNEIFRRFYREPKAYKVEGFGIGLYLVRKIITLQGGYVKVKSEPGKGSVFSIFLPNRAG